MIEIFGIETPPAAGVPLLIVCTDREVHKTIVAAGSKLFQLYKDPDYYISTSQIIGWVPFDSLTAEQKDLDDTIIRDENWSFKDSQPEFRPIAFEKEAGSVPPNNTIVTLLMPSGLLVEATTRGSGFFPESDPLHDCGKVCFNSDDIVGWVRQKELSSRQRACISTVITRDMWT